MGKGETHEQIWADLIMDTKPVLANWFADHYLVPDIWYEARLNFIIYCYLFDDWLCDWTWRQAW